MYLFQLATLVKKFKPKNNVIGLIKKIRAQTKKKFVFSVSIVSRPNTISSLLVVQNGLRLFVEEHS